jgi:uncharacterized membrane-anchored protein YitT (DUF2179 family)
MNYLKNVNWEKLGQKLSASVIYGILSAVALNFFYQPAHVYSSGITGLSQILTTVSREWFGLHLPIALTILILNIPVLLLSWFKLDKKLTLYTILTLVLSSLFIARIPEITLTTDPVINAIFGGAIMGTGIGYGLRAGISSGGVDIISLYLQRKTGHQVGAIGLAVNGVIVLVAGILFGWKYMFYSMVAIFVSTRVTDAIFTKQKKMQVMIVTAHPDRVTGALQDGLHRGVTIIHGVEGGYMHNELTMLMTVIRMSEFQDLKDIMRDTDPKAFVSVSENVRILGRFNEDI